MCESSFRANFCECNRSHGVVITSDMLTAEQKENLYEKMITSDMLAPARDECLYEKRYCFGETPGYEIPHDYEDDSYPEWTSYKSRGKKKFK